MTVLLGIVRGNIHSTINHAAYDNRRLLVIDLIDAEDKPTGKYLIAVDTIYAGVGDRVLITDEGNGARQVLKDVNAPIRSVIVGIVDEVIADAGD
jgi:microcompartment protein CcmK/EutM